MADFASSLIMLCTHAKTLNQTLHLRILENKPPADQSTLDLLLAKVICSVLGIEGGRAQVGE